MRIVTCDLIPLAVLKLVVILFVSRIDPRVTCDLIPLAVWHKKRAVRLFFYACFEMGIASMVALFLTRMSASFRL